MTVTEPEVVVFAAEQPAGRTWFQPERLKSFSLLAVLAGSVLIFSVVVDDYLTRGS